MKKIVLCLACCCMLTATTAKAEKKDDSKYLAGAVPVENGKVVFTREFNITGMQKAEIYRRIHTWMENHLQKGLEGSRIVYTNEEQGQIVANGVEHIIFSSTALALDRTTLHYMLTAKCQDGKCILRMERMRYDYREGKDKEHYKAEEWIVDKYALNKAQTKLVLGLAKWRRKTVDFVDNLVAEAASALDTSERVSNVQLVTVNTQNAQPTTTQQPVVQPKAVQAVQMTPVVQTAPATAQQMQVLSEVAPEQIPANAIQTGSGKLVIVIGEEPFNMTMMTANAGGSLGKVNGKMVVFCILSPDQPYQQLEQSETYAVRFYPNGSKEPSVVLQCKKQPAPAAIEGMPRTFVGEIIKAEMLK